MLTLELLLSPLRLEEWSTPTSSTRMCAVSLSKPILAQLLTMEKFLAIMWSKLDKEYLLDKELEQWDN